MNTTAVYGTVDHVDPSHFDASEFADLFYQAALQIQVAGYSDGRTVGVIYGTDQNNHTWYPSVSLRVLDEVVTYSLAPENAAALAAEMSRRARLPKVSGCTASTAFFRFFAEELPGMIRFAERKNASGIPPRCRDMSLAVVAAAGHA